MNKIWRLKYHNEVGEEAISNCLSMTDLLREVEDSIGAGAIVLEIKEMRPVGDWPSGSAGEPR